MDINGLYGNSEIKLFSIAFEADMMETDLHRDFSLAHYNLIKHPTDSAS